IHALWQEHMIASLKESKINEGNRCLTSRREQCPVTVFQFTNPPREFECRWRAIQSVGVSGLVLVPVVGDRGSVRKEHSRAAEYRCGEGAESLRYLRVRVNQLGRPLLRHNGRITRNVCRPPRSKAGPRNPRVARRAFRRQMHYLVDKLLT